MRFFLHVIKRLPIVCPIIEHLQHLFKYIIGRDGIKQGHAGTNLNEDGAFTTDGGRVLLVAAKSKTLKNAQDKVYKELEKLESDGVFYRKDIGFKAIK